MLRLTKDIDPNHTKELLQNVGSQIQSASRAIALALKNMDSDRLMRSTFDEMRNGSGDAGLPTLIATARNMIFQRRLRDRVIGGGGLFGEPAWEIMLDLFIATAEGKSISVSSACIGSAGPPTTALRYLSVLDEQRLVERFKHATDARVIHVRLSELAMAKMSAILSASTPASPPLL
jgi:hypothetical protein